MEVFGKVKLNFQVRYIGCLSCKNCNSGPVALGESNGMQAASLLSSFRVVSSILNLNQHQLFIPKIMQHFSRVFGFFCLFFWLGNICSHKHRCFLLLLKILIFR